MIFSYKCIICGKEFTKDTLVKCHNQRYCEECCKKLIKERNKNAWRLRRDRERKKLADRHNGRDSRVSI